MTHSQLDSMLAESGLAPGEATELEELLGPLAALSAETPAPSGELVRVLAGEATRTGSTRRPPVRRRRRNTRGTLTGVVVLAMSGVGATGLSAAANTLPSAWQHQVAGFSHHYLPFDFPEPRAHKPRHSFPAPGAGPAQPRESTAGGARFDASNEATRSADRSPYPDAAPRAAGVSWSGQDPRPQKSETATPRGSHVPPGNGTGEDRSGQPYEVRGSSQTPVAGHEAEDRSRNHDRDRDKARDGEKSNDKGDENSNKDEYDGVSERPVRGGGSGDPKDPETGKPSGGGDQDGAWKDRTGDKQDEQKAPPTGDEGDTGPAEHVLPDAVGDTLSRLGQGAQDQRQGDVPRT